MDTRLGSAITVCDVSGVRLALKDGANANTCIPWRFPSYWGGKLENVPILTVAAYQGYAALVATILKEGKPNVETKGDCHLAPLAVATRRGHTNIVRKLLDYGADSNSKDSKDGATPIHIAVQNGHISTAQLLKERGGNLEAVDNAGNTPLHGAAWFGKRAMVDWLLKKGVTATATNNKGSTVADLAESRGHKHLAEWLRSNMYKKDMKKEIDDKQPQCEISLYTRPLDNVTGCSRSLATHWAVTFLWADGHKTTTEAFCNNFNNDYILKPEWYDGDVDPQYKWSKIGTYEARDCSSKEVLEYINKLGGNTYNILNNNCQSFVTALAEQFGVNLPISGSRMVDSLTRLASSRNSLTRRTSSKKRKI